MNNKVLGLDLGSNSIGWTVIDKQQKIQDSGVRVFPEGVNRETNGSEVSKNETRRNARGARRQQFRRKMRRKLLSCLLQENEMMPLEKEEEEIKKWFKIDPYEFRKKAWDEKISLRELGRIFYHLSQRRGFKSNRKTGDDKKEGVMNEGKDGKTGINETEECIKQHGSLGKFLASLDPHQKRILNRYTTRQMYLDEFYEVWRKQASHHPELTETLMHEIGGEFKQDKTSTVKLEIEKFYEIWKEQTSHHPELTETLMHKIGGELDQYKTSTVKLEIEKFYEIWKEQASHHPELTETLMHKIGRELDQCKTGTVKLEIEKFYEIWKEQASHHPELTETLMHKIGGELDQYKTSTVKLEIEKFYEIWKEQASHHPELTETLMHKIGRELDQYKTSTVKLKKEGVIFHQRPLRSQKYLIGKCSFEPSKRRAPKSCIPFEKFRAWQWSHTVEYDGKKLNKEERQKVVDYLLSKDKPTFKTIVKEALKMKFDEYAFNYQKPENDGKKKGLEDKIVGSTVIRQLNKIFKDWDDKSDEKQEYIWHVCFSATDQDWLEKYAREKWRLDEKQIDTLKKIKFTSDYANLSRKAINAILKFLPDYPYHQAVALAGVKKAMGERWQDLKLDEKISLKREVVDRVGSGETGGYMEKLKNYLKQNYQLDEKRLQKLYHHSVIKEEEIRGCLPSGPDADREIQNLRNPIVIQALFELRKLVNVLLEKHGPFKKIKVELARDLKNSKKKREEIKWEQKQRGKYNDEVKDKLKEYNKTINHDNILKYKLWEECQHTCPYTGNNIGIEKLFSGEIQIEHIVPWSRSLNDSFNNKTLCYADENQAKGNKTPYEFYGSDPKKWEKVKQGVKELFAKGDRKKFPDRYRKFLLFVKETVDDDFVSRQLNDTRYISRSAKDYLKKICPKEVSVNPGQMTAHFRRHWELNKILNDSDDIKNRSDHRHHAIDAIVIACLKPEHLQQLSKWNRYKKGNNYKPDITPPWTNFRKNVKDAVDQILVSHRKVSRVLTVRNHKTKKNGSKYTNKGVAARGQLHKESNYGKRKNPITKKEGFHIRKPLTDLTPAMFPKIVDEKIRELACERLEYKKVPKKNDGKYDEKSEAFKTAFKEPLQLKNCNAKIHNGKPIPVRKVRIAENSTGAVQLKEGTNRWVETSVHGGNHHAIIYHDSEGQLAEEVVTFFEAVRRKRDGQELFQLPKDDVEIVTTLQHNDMFLLGLRDEEIDWDKPDKKLLRDHLYRVQKLSSEDYYFRLATESEIKTIKFPYCWSIKGPTKAWQAANPIKVNLAVDGTISKNGSNIHKD